jgi:hypothetical protein
MSKKPRLTPEELDGRTEFYATVGQGISNWTRVEVRLIQIAARLLGSSVEKAGAIFYSIINFHNWLSIIDELLFLDQRFMPAKNDWNKLAGKLRALNDMRMRLAHHTVWHTSDDPGRPTLKPAKEDTRKKSRSHKPLTATQILDFTNATTRVVNELRSFLAKINSLDA